MIRALSNGDILVRGILLVRVQYTRAMYYTRAGNTKRTHKNTRARIIWCIENPPVMRSIHTTPRETPESFSQSICGRFKKPTCVITRIVAGKSEERPVACCVVLASSRLDVNGAVRKRLGTRKASFASPEETTECSGGMMIGGVTPFGLPGDLPVWIDALVMQRTQVIVGGGSRDRKILCPPQALAALPTAEVVESLAKAAT